MLRTFAAILVAQHIFDEVEGTHWSDCFITVQSSRYINLLLRLLGTIITKSNDIYLAPVFLLPWVTVLSAGNAMRDAEQLLRGVDLHEVPIAPLKSV